MSWVVSKVNNSIWKLKDSFHLGGGGWCCSSSSCSILWFVLLLLLLMFCHYNFYHGLGWWMVGVPIVCLTIFVGWCCYCHEHYCCWCWYCLRRHTKIITIIISFSLLFTSKHLYTTKVFDDDVVMLLKDVLCIYLNPTMCITKTLREGTMSTTWIVAWYLLDSLHPNKTIYADKHFDVIDSRFDIRKSKPQMIGC